jgi:hypothetical protein
MKHYYKNGVITSNPTIPNTILPTEETIIENGWYIYDENLPEYNVRTHYIEKSDILINGNVAIQTYNINEHTLH